MSFVFSLHNGIDAQDISLIRVTTGDEVALVSAGITIQMPRVDSYAVLEGPPVISRMAPADRVANLTFDVIGETKLKCEANIAKIKRLVSGTNSQAARFTKNRTGKRIYLKVQSSNGTETLHPIKYGVVNDSAAHYSNVAQVGLTAYDIVATLVLEPDGIAADWVKVNNQLANAGFLDGVTTYWGSNGSPTTSLDTDSYLVFGNSWKAVTDTSTTQSLASSATNLLWSVGAQYVTSYIWVQRDAGGDDLKIYLHDGTGIVSGSDKKFDTVTALSTTRSKIDRVGNTWYKIETSGLTNASSTYCQIRVERNSSDATVATTFRIDAGYQDYDASALPASPDAWSTNVSLTNVTAAKTNQRFVVWDIPGDAPAITKIQIDDGDQAVIAGRGWAESDTSNQWERATETNGAANLTTSLGPGAWTSPAPGGTGDPWTSVAVGKFTEGAPSPAGAIFRITVSSNNVVAMRDEPHRILMSAYTNAANLTVTWTAGILNASGQQDMGESFVTARPLTTSDWSIIDCGPMDLSGIPDDITSVTSLNITFTISGLANLEFFEYAGCWFVPLGEYIITRIGDNNDMLPTEFNGFTREVYVDDKTSSAPFLGTLWEALPGEENHYVFLVQDSQTAPSGQGSGTVSFWYKARAEHVIGLP